MKKTIIKVIAIIIVCSIFLMNYKYTSFSDTADSAIKTENIYVTISKEVTESDKEAFVIKIENKRGETIDGAFEISFLNAEVNLEEAEWIIGEEQYAVKLNGTSLTADYYIKLPEELSGRKETARLVLEYETDESANPTIELTGFDFEYKYDMVKPGCLVVNDLISETMFGKYNEPGGVFSIENIQENDAKELIFSDGEYEIMSYENEDSPWSYYEDKVEKVTVLDINEICSNVLSSCENLKEIYFYGRDTTIADDVFVNDNGKDITIYGYYDSTAEEYAKSNGYIFIAFDRSQEGTEKYSSNEVHWNYDEVKKEMTISGNGVIQDYFTVGFVQDNRWWISNKYSRTPWDYFADDVVTLIINDGITKVGQWAFYDFTSLKDIYIADSVEKMLFAQTDGEGNVLSYSQIFSNEIKEQAVIHCSTGTEAERFAFLNQFKFEVESAVRGDINNDEIINAEDALAILKMAAKLIDEKYYQADYNIDFKINANDALDVLKTAAKIE